jgi:hypothetical protein
MIARRPDQASYAPTPLRGPHPRFAAAQRGKKEHQPRAGDRQETHTMSDVVTDLTDEDLRTELTADQPRAEADDDGTDAPQDGVDADDDAADADDDASDGGDADGTDA